MDVAKEAAGMDDAFSFPASKEGIGTMYSMVNDVVFEKRRGFAKKKKGI